MKRIFTLSLLSISLVIAPSASESLTATFDAQLDVSLCAEMGFQNATLNVGYRIGDGTELYPAEIVAQTVNKKKLKGTYDIRLPATLVTTPLNIVARCENSHGVGLESNVVSISNCDSLATIDSDGDGITNNHEDLNCDNSFSPGDLSNPFNVDTDGDGVRDLVEVFAATDPTNPGSNPRPLIYASAAFDPDGDGKSNPLAWRPSNGTWYIRDFSAAGNHTSVQLGQVGDVPFVYETYGMTSNVGVIRPSGLSLIWYFNGAGFLKSNNTRLTQLPFGIFGDNLVPGPWEHAEQTNPAVARLYNNMWFFYIYLADGTIREVVWGGNGDIPKVQDYDGDGVFDIAVFRPSAQKTYVINSSDNSVHIYTFGTGTADHTVRGDNTGDGIDDISFWEPISGVFTTMTSDYGFDPAKAAQKDPKYFKKLQLGLYVTHVPMSWNKQNGKILYTVVDHATGFRYWRPGNKGSNSIQSVQWGVTGDSLL